VLILSTENKPDSIGPDSPVNSTKAQADNKKFLALGVGILVSLGLIYYLFKDLDFDKFKQELSNFNPFYIFPLTILLSLVMVFRALRAKYLLPIENRKNATFMALLQSVLVGFSANSLLPMRAGEILRPLYLQRQIGLPFTAGLASLFTERIFDLLALLSVAALLFSRIQNPPLFLVTTSAALGAISCVGVFGLILCAFFGKFTLNLAKKIFSYLLPEKISSVLLKLLSQVIDTLGAAKSIKDISFIVIYSLGIWVVTGLYYQMAAKMLGVDLSLFAGLLISVTIAFAVAAPSSPGFIGTFQFGCALTLTNILNLSQEFSLAYGLVVHAIQTATLLLVTAAVLAFSGQGLKSVLKSTSPGT
jgi:uncharacterized protein (TIRG00374 family)